jgi:hypothetical protein
VNYYISVIKTSLERGETYHDMINCANEWVLGTRKDVEGSRRHQDEAGAWRLLGGAGQLGPTCHWPLLRMAVLYRPKDRISTIVQCRFDPRAVVHPTGLYNQTQTPPCGINSISLEGKVPIRNPNLFRTPPILGHS